MVSIVGDDPNLDFFPNEYDKRKGIHGAVPLDEKIHADVAMPKLIKKADEVESSQINLQNRIDEDISAPKKLIDRINAELLAIDDMLNDPKCNFSLVLQQAYRVLDLLQRLTSRNDKSYSLDKEPEIWDQVQQLKGSYNTWQVMVTAIVTGVLSGISGLVGIAAVFPGTPAGQALADASPKLFSAFANADGAKTIRDISDATQKFSQGTGSIQKLVGDTDEAKRVVYNYMMQEYQRKQNDRNESSRQARDQGSAALNNCRSVMEALHRVFESILKGTTA